MSLELRDVTVRFGARIAVDGVDLEVDDGEVLALLGPSGSGKSTLLRAITGFEAYTGWIAWDGAELARVPVHRRGFAMMFQDGQLFPHLDVARNIAYPIRLRGRPWRERVEELLELVGLPGFGPRSIAELSGGEQQRVAFARALAAGPRLLLLDEPLSALDRRLRERLAEDLRAILVATGTTAILVTHDHGEAETVADRVAVIAEGRLLQSGTMAELRADPVEPRVREFLGES